MSYRRQARAKARRLVRYPPPPPLPLVDCRIYSSGHNLHWIQALRSTNDPKARAATWSGRVIRIDGDWLTVEKEDGTLIRFYHHNIERLRLKTRGVGALVSVNDQFAILRWCGVGFSVRSEHGEPVRPCIPAEVRA